MLIKTYLYKTIVTKAKFSFCFGFIVFSPYFFDGQKKSLDSLNLDNLEKDFRISHPELAFSKPLQFTDAYTFINQNDLNFKRTQTPSKITEYGFGAQGVFVMNPKVILSGEMQIKRQDEKDVSFILTDERTTNQNYISNPSYFYAPRASNWLKQDYLLGGNLSYKPIQNIFLNVSVRGNFLKAFANSDPRPEVSNYKYEAEFKLGYKYKKHLVFGKASYINRRKESLIAYSIPELNAPNYYLTYIRFNRGYGNYYYNDNYGNTKYQYDGWNFGAEYQFNTDKTNIVIGADNVYYIDRNSRFYTYQIRDNDNVLREYRDEKLVSGLKTERNVLYAKLLTSFASWRWSSLINFTDQKDQNFDYENRYTSYRAYNTSFSFKNIWSKFNSKKELLRFYFDAKIGDQDIKDVSVVLQKKLSFFEYQLGTEKEFRISDNKKLGFDLHQGLYLPIKSSFLYNPYQSTQENVFVKNIAIPDYFYDTSSRFDLGLKLKYLWDKNNVRYEIYASTNQMFFMNNTEKLSKDLYNTKANSLYSFGINFYY